MKKTVLKAVLSLSLLAGGLFFSSTVTHAHGYVSSPGSRAYFGSAAGGKVNKNVGRAEWEPQSIEATKNTFITGKLASAGVSGFDPLDEQTADRWFKSDITTGPLAINWTLTARHRTSTWNYYMTKQGWNPNQPLDIKNFDLIATVDDNAAIPEASVKHTVTVPSDRKGYHVIYAVWNVYDTTNAFYQAIDVNVK
ncbi:lytic polysaccharide monooxygenase [Enterococcus termitis]|uniref:Chitin-binding protein n=1 Tax=Enterococcus termitis TaxID=332950 RepID=A0A1E5G9B7_9ENTE|nr:lytic polysaccharide monooxygenase [Enterococcus termitis]OEG09175.1 chitin-binding protein [Enterococcus termitis]OJG98632.1 chitin binding protein [Enterococcus termitis]